MNDNTYDMLIAILSVLAVCLLIAWAGVSILIWKVKSSGFHTLVIV
jgi:hypothetical protein